MSRSAPSRLSTTTIFQKYLHHHEINGYLFSLKQLYPNRCLIECAGLSYERRKIYYIRISKNIHETIIKQKNRKIIFIDGGTHAREWVSVSSAIFCIHQLLEKYKSNKKLLEDFDWIILPLVNPDGYEFSLNYDSNWRKNRKPTPNRRSIGTDCNRNFDINWNKGYSDPKSNQYRGVHPFSENETRIVRDLMMKLKPNIKFYLTMHSYSQSILYPFAFKRECPDNWEELYHLAKLTVDELKHSTGIKYKFGQTSCVIRRTIPGSACDYALMSGIQFAITFELSQYNRTGFHPPKSKILEKVQESWIGIRTMAEYVISKFNDKQE